ncbi:hypothetical protein [Methylobacterium nigriterrae]|uniref:hypothetical protein n=1 Tax=Methylobacterium nigriterrae TaxID=3127512 RepID=UPI00301376AF
MSGPTSVIGIEPAALLLIGVDETPRRFEAPRELARRLTKSKLVSVREAARKREDMQGTWLLAADTVVVG